mmetsp:Transcript_63048/g.186241  ORF Transcript_63048/g.186241 Transcript_63048/m.186241 type:complete len:228 (+) Transcript_63048:71-754(+)
MSQIKWALRITMCSTERESTSWPRCLHNPSRTCSNVIMRPVRVGYQIFRVGLRRCLINHVNKASGAVPQLAQPHHRVAPWAWPNRRPKVMPRGLLHPPQRHPREEHLESSARGNVAKLVRVLGVGREVCSSPIGALSTESRVEAHRVIHDRIRSRDRGAVKQPPFVGAAPVFRGNVLFPAGVGTPQSKRLDPLHRQDGKLCLWNPSRRGVEQICNALELGRAVAKLT